MFQAMLRPDVAYMRVLRKAVQIAGGEPALATAWRVLPESLASWLSGAVVLPAFFYIAALEMLQRDQERELRPKAQPF